MSRIITIALAAALLGAGSACTTGVSNQLPTTPPPQDAGGFDVGLPHGDSLQWPPIDTGDGHDGDLVVTASPTTINDCFEVVSGVDASLSFLNAPTLTEGRRLLVMQMQDEFATSGPTALVESAELAGEVEVARVKAVNGVSVTVETNLKNDYDATAGTARAQACTIPEYENVTVDASGSLDAVPWDGSTGGILAFYAHGAVEIGGALNASAAGFRGGVIFGNSGANSITTEDTQPNQGGGKGEGLDGRSMDISGRGAMGNAGGGGNAHNAGGGGGGNGGAGGFGGMQAQSFGANPDTRGRAGGAVNLGSPLQLVLGGGGGAAQQDDGDSGPGGAGGGAIFLSVARLTGAGSILADGQRGFDGGAGGNGEGGGGGGAGGTIVVMSIVSEFTGAIHAVGGDGGDHVSNNAQHGTGGGGGGGRVVFGGIPPTSIDVSGGTSGVNTQSNDDPWGATNGDPGVVLTP